MATVILGANSMLGWAVFQSLSEARGYCSPTTRRPRGSGLLALDLTDAATVAEAVKDAEVVIHCGAICKVEKCETHPAFAHAINVGGTRHLLDHLDPKTRLVYCSSDHVFGGDSGPYDEDSPPCPLSFYGQTRVEAERLVRDRRPDALVIRVSLCIGQSYNGRSGHLDWLRYRKSQGLPMTVVSDEFRSAVWCSDAARRVLEWTRSDLDGLRHLGADRLVSRPELANYLNQRFQIGASFQEVRRSDRGVPHLGRVELITRFEDPPLASVVKTSM